MKLNVTKAEVDRAYNMETLSSDEASDLDYYLDLERKGQLSPSQRKDASVLIRRMRARSSRGTRAFTVLSKTPRGKGSLQYVVYATSEAAARQQFRRKFGGPITRVVEGKSSAYLGDASRDRMKTCDGCNKKRADVKPVGDGEVSLCFVCRKENAKGRHWSHREGRYAHHLRDWPGDRAGHRRAARKGWARKKRASRAASTLARRRYR